MVAVARCSRGNAGPDRCDIKQTQDGWHGNIAAGLERREHYRIGSACAGLGYRAASVVTTLPGNLRALYSTITLYPCHSMRCVLSFFYGSFVDRVHYDYLSTH